jgi:hypothetical protein
MVAPVFRVAFFPRDMIARCRIVAVVVQERNCGVFECARSATLVMQGGVN